MNHEVQSIGNLNIEIFHKIRIDIISTQVIMTTERLKHINKDHPGDYKQYRDYIKEVIEAPDYIIKANRPFSVVMLKK